MNLKVEIAFKRGDIPRAIRKFGLSDEDLRGIMKDAGLPFAKEVLAKSDVLVPVKFGNLKATGAALGPQRTAGGFQVQVKYGGGAARDKSLPRPDVLGPNKVDYALLQHETNASRRGFLVTPFLANRNIYFDKLKRSFELLFLRRSRGGR